MSEQVLHLKQWIDEMAVLIDNEVDPEPQYFISFLNEPTLSLALIDVINALEDDVEERRSYYSACLFALDICVAQLQSAVETGSKLATKILNQLMQSLADAINHNEHSLSFWLPILNAFYDVHVELSPPLRDAYLTLAGNEEDTLVDSEEDHLQAIKNMINELSDLSVFDIADNFFAQSHAMPADFFADLLVDLYSIDEGHDIALLALLHPSPEVREQVIITLTSLIDHVTFSSLSLSRLQMIKHWYKSDYHDQFNYWIRQQRKKGVTFYPEEPVKIVSMKASEIDGSGAQGLFIHIKHKAKNRLCGLLFKQEVGIKDAWLTPPLSLQGIKQYYADAFDDTITLRNVDEEYALLLLSHFLAITLENQSMPDLHLLEIQQLLGWHLSPQRLDIEATMASLSIQITPFTEEARQLSFKRSKSWLSTKAFTETWFVENANVDKLVNRCSTFVDGVKVCHTKDAMAAVFTHELEPRREKWLFHFLWISLWLKSHARKNEKLWQDSFFIAFAIYSGEKLENIPVLGEICRQTVTNSIETMHERRTYLSKE